MLAKPFEHSMTLSSLVLRQGVALRKLTNWHAIDGIRVNLSYALLLRVAKKQMKREECGTLVFSKILQEQQ